ncbi:MAG: hypothetical protein CMI18_00945 [Opitutaceae bacterium]|nr:hypothetical protein [Opitutaceae bacterium]
MPVPQQTFDWAVMTIHELEHYLPHSSANPLHSLQNAKSLIPDNLAVYEHVLEDGKSVELTLDRNRGKMILKTHRGGD